MLAAIGPAAGVAAGGRPFTSLRNHYTITLAPGWTVRPATQNASSPFPDPDGPESDEFNDPGNPLFPTIGISAQNLRAGTTPQQWARRVTETLHTTYGCSRHTQTSPRLAGEAAKVFAYTRCPQYLIVIATVHDGRGYVLFWAGPGTETRTRTQAAAAFDRFLRTFRFIN